MAKTSRTVIGGVDTHADTHTAAALDSAGRLLGHRQFATTAGGCQALLAWLRRHGQLKAVGVEGTGSYGAGLARLLTASGVHVVEVDRPNRKARRSTGKSDPVDAEAAARAVLAGVATGTPKSRSGVVEAIRVLRVVRTGAVKARTAGLNTLVNLARTAPEPLGAHVHGHSARQLVRLANTWRPAGTLHDPVTATKSAMRRLARRIIELDQEIRAADLELRTLLQLVAPKLLDCRGVVAIQVGEAGADHSRSGIGVVDRGLPATRAGWCADRRGCQAAAGVRAGGIQGPVVNRRCSASKRVMPHWAAVDR